MSGNVVVDVLLDDRPTVALDLGTTVGKLTRDTQAVPSWSEEMRS
jgi:hypothetical protein